MMRIWFPPLLKIDERVNRNVVQQFVEPGYYQNANVETFIENDVKEYLITPLLHDGDPILAVTSDANLNNKYQRILRIRSGSQEVEKVALSLSDGSWVRHPLLNDVLAHPIDYANQISEVISSWQNSFSFIEESLDFDKLGLRIPQIGAIHAVLAHWAITDEAATVVMPTGTGKTETMLSVLVSRRCSKLLVIVPTDALRTQIAAKFMSLGILKDLGVVDRKALFPIVGILKHKPRDIYEVDIFFQKCNVIITTMNIAGQCAEDVQERFAYHCPYLFIDEAHHIAAKTWRELKQKFRSARILQFTATPFRNDGKLVDGKPIFNFPLKKAQEQGYFNRINYTPVFSYDPNYNDLMIAEKAIEQLREDRRKGYDHILMARVDSIERAKAVFNIYQKYEEFNPVQIHTGIKLQKEREKIRQKIVSKEARVVVCVDMLGEGFDLPELKIAALHDVRKSLPITLQLIGRFTRDRKDLGQPTFIANAGDITVEGELRDLYSQDADWNLLLPQRSEKATQEQIDMWEFNQGFRKFPSEIPIQNIRPAMSTIIYKTQCEDWFPENCLNGIDGIENYEWKQFSVNNYKNTIIIMTARRIPIDWAQMDDIYNLDWELYVIFWDREQQLLFINSSSNSGYYQKLADAIMAKSALIKGAQIFRCLSGINRLMLQNVGLIEEYGRLIRYIMSAGSDVEAGLSEAQKRAARKANIFGVGYQDGEKTSIGCSYKGRVWSRRVTNPFGLTKWCVKIGQKILDETIDPDEVLKGTLVSVEVASRPTKMPITIEWPEIMYIEPEIAYSFTIGDNYSIPLYEADIRLKDPSENGRLLFELVTDDVTVELELILFERNGYGDYRYNISENCSIIVRRKSSSINIEEFFYENSPKIWFADGSSLEGNSFTELRHKYHPYPVEKILTLDWSGVNIRKESQGINRETDSIQYRLIQELLKENYEIVFDDDGSGEAADVIAMHENDDSITINFYHCKFSKEDKPGGRIDDLYAVCGQAQKSIRWREKPIDLLKHFQKREPKKKNGKTTSRFIRGDRNLLEKFRFKLAVLPINLNIFIVQPGLAKAKVTPEQLELLSVTENYLLETYKLPFGVIAHS